MQHVVNLEARVSQSDYRCEPALWGTVGAPNIITMEDDSDDNLDEESGQGAGQDILFSLPPEGDHGPFNTLTGG